MIRIECNNFLSIGFNMDTDQARWQLHLAMVSISSTLCPVSRLYVTDVNFGRLRTSLWVTIKCACFKAIPYTTHAFYGNLPEIGQSTTSDITSNLEVGQSENYWLQIPYHKSIFLTSDLICLITSHIVNPMRTTYM